MNGRIAHILRPWEEVIGVLNNLSANNGKLILSISSTINLEVPDQSVNKEMLEKVLGHRVGILRTDQGYLIRVFKTPNINYIAHDEEQESEHNSSTKEKHKEGSFETIRAVGPDLKQSLKQKESWENETKTERLLLQTLYFLLFQRIVAFFGPMYLLHSHFVDFSVRSRLFQNCILEGGGMILNV